jgi:hypothetical protein
MRSVGLTPDVVGDFSMTPDLLDQTDGHAVSMTGDGAYDGNVVYDAVIEHYPKAAIIIPPRSTAVPSEIASFVARQSG